MRKRSIAQQPEEGGADCKGALEEPCSLGWVTIASLWQILLSSGEWRERFWSYGYSYSVYIPYLIRSPGASESFPTI